MPPATRTRVSTARWLGPLALLLISACKGEVQYVPDPAAAGTTAHPGRGGTTGQPSAGTGSGATSGLGTGGNSSAAGGSAGNSTGSGATGAVSSTGGSGPTACTSSESPGVPVPMRRLTASQVRRTVTNLFGVDVPVEVGDETIFTYRSNISTSVDAASARGYFDFATRVVERVDWQRCAENCLPWLLDEIGLQLFRRPLDEAERERYSALFELGVENADEQAAAGWVLEAMLQSPTFLYLDESVDADGMLDDYAMAARLSLALWGANPDAELLARAASGKLSTPVRVAEEAARLLADPRSEAGVREFVDQWLALARLDDPDTRPDLAELGSETVTALREEPVRFFQTLLLDGAGLGELLTSASVPATTELEELYGDDIVRRSSGIFELDPERRGGILALPGVAAALSHARRTSPTVRGKAILTGLLCTPPEPPPADVDTTLPEVDEDVTTRERLEIHMTAPACRGCHVGMDGIGFALEKLDWLGRSREEENDKPIDDTSTFPLGADEVTVTGAAELGATLAASPDVAACVAKQWLRYAAGTTETAAADCLVNELTRELEGPAGLERMIVRALSSDWLRRGPGEMP